MGGEGRCDFRTVRDEAAIEVDHTKESSDLAAGSRIGVFRYSFDFGLEGPITLVIYHVTEETYFGSPKAALVRVHHQSIIVLLPENLFQVLQVLAIFIGRDWFLVVCTYEFDG